MRYGGIAVQTPPRRHEPRGAGSRRRVWRLVVALVGLASVLGAPAGGRAAACPSPVLSALGPRLAAGLAGDTVFGLPLEEAAWVFYPVTRERALPPDYRPPDLVWTTAGGSAPQGAQPVRQLIVPDLEALIAAARADGVVLGIVSGYRSAETQAALFTQGVQQQLARGAPDRGEAEARVNRFRARPGHSQHQLGTTVDMTSPEAGNQLGARFAASPAAAWLRARAWEFGFIIPYTEAGEARTGYAPEPWHLRWVGRSLAALLAADGYLERAEPVVDDYLIALDLLLADLLGSCEPD